MIFYKNSSISTQEDAKALSLLYKKHVVFWTQAGSQVKGRGQRGRNWVSEKGNIFLTGYFQNLVQKFPGQVAILVGVVVAQTLESFIDKEKISLKWPNDILIDGKKCGGILIEKNDDAYIVGIGLNIVSHPLDLPVTHIGLYANIDMWDTSLKIQENITVALQTPEDFLFVKQQWWSFAKRSIDVWGNSDVLKGKVLGIDDEGQLLIRMPDGSASVRHQTF